MPRKVTTHRRWGWTTPAQEETTWLPGLVNIQKTMENHHFQWVNPLFQWPFSIAMLNYQRVLKTQGTKRLVPGWTTYSSNFRFRTDFFPKLFKWPTTDSICQHFPTVNMINVHGQFPIWTTLITCSKRLWTYGYAYFMIVKSHRIHVCYIW